MSDRPDNIRKRLGLPEKIRLQSAVAKSEMAITFLSAIVNSAIEQGDEGLRLCSENALDAVTELRLLAEEAAFSEPQS